MSAKKPQSDHGKALAAFQRGWITRKEYQECWAGYAWVSGRGLWRWRKTLFLYRLELVPLSQGRAAKLTGKKAA